MGQFSRQKFKIFIMGTISMIMGVWITTMLPVIMLHLWQPHRALPDSIQKQVITFPIAEWHRSKL